MKTLIIVRHAKSVNAVEGQKDFDRPLAESGKSTAGVMAKRLLDRGVQIDTFISSPARRAYKTCKIIAAVFGVKKDDIICKNSLYHAPSHVFYEVIHALPATENKVAIFGHNPGITDFVNSLCDDAYIDDMPTCAAFAVRANISDWKNFAEAKKDFLYFEKPL